MAWPTPHTRTPHIRPGWALCAPGKPLATCMVLVPCAALKSGRVVVGSLTQAWRGGRTSTQTKSRAKRPEREQQSTMQPQPHSHVLAQVKSGHTMVPSRDCSGKEWSRHGAVTCLLRYRVVTPWCVHVLAQVKSGHAMVRLRDCSSKEWSRHGAFT